MNKQQFVAAARRDGRAHAIAYAAMLGVAMAQVQLWVRGL